MDDEWRRWAAENLLLGEPPERVVETMAAKGIDRQEAMREVLQAQESPYMKGAARMTNRLRKRDWQLAMYAKLRQLHPHSDAIERRHQLTAEGFLSDYYSTNRPVILTGMLDDWPAMQLWNLEYFERRIGDAPIEIQFGRHGHQEYEIKREHFVRQLPFNQFLDMIRNTQSTNDFYCTAGNNSFNRTSLAPLWRDIIQIPEYLDPSSSVDGFFWLGPRGTLTPFHHDLTNNFMAQIMGRKLVKLVASYETPLMRNHFHCYSEWRTEDLVDQCAGSNNRPHVIQCVLEPGELLFLPIGWWHLVEGLDITTTITFTNFRWDNDFHSFYSTYHAV